VVFANPSSLSQDKLFSLLNHLTSGSAGGQVIDEPEAFEINSKLFNAIQSAIDLLSKAMQESDEMLSNMQNRLDRRCGVVNSDGRIEKKEQAKFDIKLQEIEKQKN
jgi:hypothetical protein